MGAAYVLAGILGGLCGFGTSLLFGASLWTALGMYVVAGTSLILLAAAISALRCREADLPSSLLRGFKTIMAPIKSYATDCYSSLSKDVLRDENALLPGDRKCPAGLVPQTIKPGRRANPAKS